MLSLPQFIDDIRSRIQPRNGKIHDFSAFIEKLNMRREWGRHEYADSSKTKPAKYISQEVGLEFVDVPSWIFDLLNCPQQLSAEDRHEWLKLGADTVDLWFRYRELDRRLPNPPSFNCHVGGRSDWRSDATGDAA